jgi:hypothetical protein
LFHVDSVRNQRARNTAVTQCANNAVTPVSAGVVGAEDDAHVSVRERRRLLHGRDAELLGDALCDRRLRRLLVVDDRRRGARRAGVPGQPAQVSAALARLARPVVVVPFRTTTVVVPCCAGVAAAALSAPVEPEPADEDADGFDVAEGFAVADADVDAEGESDPLNE